MTVLCWICLQVLLPITQDSGANVGVVRAVRQTTVSAETPGRLKRRHDVELKQVKQGAMIYEIDDSLQRADFRSAVAGLSAARADLSFASSELKRLRALAADDASSRAAIELGEATEEGAKASVARAEAATARAEFFMSKTRVTAPYKGVLTRLFPEQGEYVRIGQPLFQIMDPSQVKVESWVDATTVRKLKAGQEVTVTSGKRTVKGTIDRIAIGNDNPARTLKVIIRVDNKQAANGVRPLLVGVRVYWSVSQ